MAKKTLEAKLRMIDETQAATRSASASARALTGEYDKLDKAMRQAMRGATQDRRAADRTIERARISNLEREVRLGHEGASVALEQARATATFRREREALLAITRNETTSLRQKAAAYRELERMERLHIANQRQIAKGPARGGSSVAGSMAMSRLGGFAAGYMGMQGVRQVADNAMRAGDDFVAFEKSSRDLYTVGENSTKIDQVRQKVLDLAAATGRAKEEIANLLFFIESGTVGMDGPTRESIEKNVLKMGRATNANMDTMAGAVIKSYRMFGDEVKNVDELVNKLFMTVERGFLTHDELARFVVQVLSAGDAFNFTLDEMLASVSVATKSAGDAGTAMTSLRNILLRLNNAEKEGIQLTGDFADRLQQLSEVDPNKLTDMFGDRTVGVLFDLVKRTKELRGEVSAFSNDVIDLNKRLADLAANGGQKYAQMVSQAREAHKNTLLGRGGDGRKALSDFEASNLDVNQGMGSLLPEDLKKLRALAATDSGGAVRGYLHLAEQAIKAGDLPGAKNLLDEAERANKTRHTADDRSWAPLTGVIGNYFLRGDPKSDTTSKSIAEMKDRLEHERKNRAAGITADDRTAEAKQAERQKMYNAARGMMDLRHTPDPNDPTADFTPRTKKALELATGGDQAAIAEIKAIAERAKKSGRQWDEQAELEATGGKLANGFIKSLVGDLNNEQIRSKLKEWSTAIFGEDVSFADKLLGKKGRQSTVLPLMGDLLRDGAANLLGRDNAAFLGIGEGSKRGRGDDDFDGLRRSRVAELSVANSGFTGQAARVKTEERMLAVWKEISGKIGETNEAVAEMIRQWGEAPVLSVPGT